MHSYLFSGMSHNRVEARLEKMSSQIEELAETQKEIKTMIQSLLEKRKEPVVSVEVPAQIRVCNYATL